MWVWREESVRGGWRLDPYGQWMYDEPPRLEQVGSPRRQIESERIAHERMAQERYAQSQSQPDHMDRDRSGPVALPERSDLEATPIFRSVAHEVRATRADRARSRHDRFDDGGRFDGPGRFGGRDRSGAGDRFDGRDRFGGGDRFDGRDRFDGADGYDRYAELEDRRRPGVPAIPEPHPGSGPIPAQGSRRGLVPVETAPPPPPRYEDEPWSGETAAEEMRRRAERRRRPRVEPESGRHVLRR